MRIICYSGSDLLQLIGNCSLFSKKIILHIKAYLFSEHVRRN